MKITTPTGEVIKPEPAPVSTLTELTRRTPPSDWDIKNLGDGKLRATHINTGETYEGPAKDFNAHLK